MDYRAKIDANGRLVLPAKVRKAMGVEPGSEVTVHVDEAEGDVRLLSKDLALQKAWRFVRRYVPEGVVLSDELIAERRTENAGEEAENSRS